MPQPPFGHSHRVTYADCTLGNHIYYARYLELLEATRGAFFRELGLGFLELQERGVLFPVIECHLRYHAPARYDDVLTVAVWPSLISRVRLNFAHRITKATGEVVLEGETFHACTNLEDKPIRLPTVLVERLNPFLPTANS